VNAGWGILFGTETVTLERNQRRTSLILTTLATLLFLLGSLPLGDGLHLVWSVSLLLLLSGVLAKWGPPLSSLGAGRIPLLGSVALFTTSILSRAADRGELFQVSIMCAAALVLAGTLCRLAPHSVTSSRLRVAVLAAIGGFALCLRTGLYSSFVSMKQGDFWVVDLPFKLALVLPHPYDFYVVARFFPLFLWASMLVSIIGSGLYLWLRTPKTRSS
jgi:hypothetical protein